MPPTFPVHPTLSCAHLSEPWSDSSYLTIASQEACSSPRLHSSASTSTLLGPQAHFLPVFLSDSCSCTPHLPSGPPAYPPACPSARYPEPPMHFQLLHPPASQIHYACTKPTFHLPVYSFSISGSSRVTSTRAHKREPIPESACPMSAVINSVALGESPVLPELGYPSLISVRILHSPLP